MNTATRNKLNEIVKLIQGGANEKDILNKKFNRNRFKMKEWINKFSNEFTPQEKNMLLFKKYEVVKQSKEDNIAVPVNALEILEQHAKKLKKLDQYEERLKELELKFESQALDGNVYSTDVLHIDDSILKLKSVVRSIRINTDLIDQLNIIAEKHLNYSKTNLWNQMLTEFIDKYK